MRMLGNALACLAGLVALLTSFLPWSIVRAMSVREILYLNKYGEAVIPAPPVVSFTEFRFSIFRI